MKTTTATLFLISIRKPFVLGVAATAVMLFANVAAFAQQGQGGCQRGRGGPNNGPPSGMSNPSGYNPQQSWSEPVTGPVAYSTRQSKQALKANYQAKLEKSRSRKAAIKAENVSRSKVKSSSTSNSSSKTT